MRDKQWVAEERRLWDLMTDDTVPRPPGVKATDKGTRAKALQRWDKAREEREARSWQALEAFIRHRLRSRIV